MTRPPARILIIDDDPGIRSMVALILGAQGDEVILSDGRDLQRPINADVVLLDVRLRGRTAADLLDEVPELAEKPIIVMTASRGTATMVAAIPRLATLPKPFDIDDLEAAVERALREPPGRDSGDRLRSDRELT